MQVLENISQGSPEWAAIRAKHHTASEAPAMMGASKYMTRNDLLKQKATGIIPEVDAAKQKLFDRGHAAEAAARVIVEEMIGEELYPATALDDAGYLLASFDGVNMTEDTGFECKLWNEKLAASVSAGDLDPHYYWQLEQQILVGSLKKVIFVCSDGTRDKFISMEYYPVPGRAEQLLAGWKQFDKDLAEYFPATAPVEVIGHTPESLPALRIEVTGMVTASNLAQYKDHALAVFKGINRELTTDQHFADADKIVKWCGEVESRLAAAKQHALSQTESIDALFRTIDDISAEARRTRLELDKLVKGRKDTLRLEIVAEGAAALREHIAALTARIGKPYMPAIPADFAGAIKGKSKFDSIRDAVKTTLANAKIAANEVADRIQANLETNGLHGYTFLFADIATLCLKPAEDFQNTVTARITAHEAKEAARLEAEREKIRAEEQAKAQREAQAAAELERQREAETHRAAAQAEALAERERQMAVVIKEVGERIQRVNESEFIKSMQDQIATGTGIAQISVVGGIQHVPVANVFQMHPASTTVATPPTLKLGEIADRIGFSLSAEFLANLGFEAHRVKNACLYQERDFPLILMRLIAHIQSVQARQAA